jgi:arylformamidase
MLYDISPPIGPRIAVWPGDSPLTREVLLEMGQPPVGSRIVSEITLSTLRATVHLGAHADAPSHYGAGAPAIDARGLDCYLGPCQVIRVPVPRGSCVTPEAVTAPITAPRVLLDTGTHPDPELFPEDFAALSPELVVWLHRQGVRLVGIDTPSVDPFPSKELPAHKTFLRHDMAILEGLVLKDVPEGVYELIALPLRLVGFDASPVRAVLRTLP